MLIDDREGSKDLVQPLIRLGVPAQLTRLEYADCAFVGNGPGGDPILCGIETKQVGDVLQCIVSGRFASHQLPGLLDHYERIWLLVVGGFRANRENGRLQVRHKYKHFWYDARTGPRYWMYREFMGWLLTMEELGSVRLAFADDDHQELRWMASTYHWWCDKEYHEHSSLKTFVDYKAKIGHRHDERNRPIMMAPTTARRVYKELPGIGWEKSIEVEQQFGSIYAAVTADVTEWAEIPGIGLKTATGVMDALHGVGKDHQTQTRVQAPALSRKDKTNTTPTKAVAKKAKTRRKPQKK